MAWVELELLRLLHSQFLPHSQRRSNSRQRVTE